MSDKETLTFSIKGIQMQADLYLADANRRDTTIIYFHGGGLLYGVRDDLPKQYVSMLLDDGYDLLALDYPLAPESSLPEILETTFAELHFYLLNGSADLGWYNKKYILFGRSAGAYLAFSMCAKLLARGYEGPTHLICLYGYSDFGHPQFSMPNKHYNKMGKITDEQAQKIIGSAPVVYGPLNERFALYIKARQEGSWLEYLGIAANSLDYSINTAMLQSFPPTLMAAATLDQDVPYRASKNLSRVIPNSKLLTIYKEEHDFDRDTCDPVGREVYQEIVRFLSGSY